MQEPLYLYKTPSPCYVCEEKLLEKNLKLLKKIKDKTGVKILVALKGFAMFSTFGLVKKYLDGACASGLYEARLSFEELGLETHTYSPAYKEIKKIAKLSNHLVFNSFNMVQKFAKKAKKINPQISLGVRINPQISASPTDLYNPCAPYSRFGITKKEFQEEIFDYGIEGFHIHALCEQGSKEFEIVLKEFEKKFGNYFKNLKWINFGGGHHITKKGYDVKRLIKILNNFKAKYPHIQTYLEPGEAIGWQTGVLVATVLDIVHNEMDIAILDTSAEAHMPDTLAMPYRANIRGATLPYKKKYTYKIAGNTCLSGDIMGDYSFDKPLRVGDRVVFEDQIHYTFVKNTTFNGIKLPSLAIWTKDNHLKVIKNFGYKDFKNRLS